jgi:hypothetical protein
MRYHFDKPQQWKAQYGQKLVCNHPIYDSCTIYRIGSKGLAVIQQRFDSAAKTTWWGEIDPWLIDAIYLKTGFFDYFNEHADKCTDGVYPTVTVRQIMWALKMKPLEKERWETVFDRNSIKTWACVR